MKPLLAHIYEPHRVTYPVFIQPKLNGIRALYQNGCFQSRDELPFAPGLLNHLSQPLREVFDDRIILDGELYVNGWPLQRILSAVTPIAKRGPTEDTLRVEFHVFDQVDFTKSFHVRGREVALTILENWSLDGQVKAVSGTYVYDEIESNRVYSQFVSYGYEGAMYRVGDCPYTVPKQTTPFANAGLICKNIMLPKSGYFSDKNNRCWHLLKRKAWLDDEFDFVSINETIGELGEPGFQVWCHAQNGRRFKFGTGLTQAEVQHYLSHPLVGRKVKGKYLVLSEEGIPLNASIVAIL